MQEAVSDILLERAGDGDGVSRMVLVSLFAHAILIAGIVVMPAGWRSASIPVDATPMVITLANSGTGPDAGGLTPISGRPVQEEAPTSKPEPVAPPAPKAPEMVVPEPAAKPAPKTPPKRVEKPVDKSTARKPTSG